MSKIEVECTQSTIPAYRPGLLRPADFLVDARPGGLTIVAASHDLGRCHAGLWLRAWAFAPPAHTLYLCEKERFTAALLVLGPHERPGFRV